MTNTPTHWNPNDIEARIAYVLDRKMRRRDQGRYAARSDEQITAQLERLFHAEGLNGVDISGLARMTGGASKEQFAFTLKHDAADESERLVLRMDPWMGIVETCRGREAQMLKHFTGVVPVPPLRFVDADGEHLGAPGLITALVPGNTAPTDVELAAVSGIGIRFAHWIPKLARQFVNHLAAIHASNWRGAEIDFFDAPAPGTTQAAMRQINWWARVWKDDLVEPDPLVTFTERWLREHAPVCDDPVVVHGDYRIGNFMFIEPSGEFSAVLDWELAHLGDFHEDLGWCVQKLFTTRDDDGTPLICGLLNREEFIARYSAQSGRTVDLNTVRYYEILGAWKCVIINNATACYAAQIGQSHQDIVLSWLSFGTAVFRAEIARLIKEAI